MALRRDVASLCIIYRIYYGECFEQLFKLIPGTSLRHHPTWQQFHQHYVITWLAKTIQPETRVVH